ncbi:UDP-galactopyranose mutase [Aphelenchoides avenae]|nr:UDP-galactopyranose mutase [Aphelenchus avenae]
MGSTDQNSTQKPNAPMKNIVIIGSGPTALGALYRLTQLMDDGTIPKVNVTVLEKEDEAGGLARTVVDEAGFCWDLGVHVTGASKYPEFLKVLQDTIPDWYSVRRIVKADMTHILGKPDGSQENYVPYPVQNSLPYFPGDLKSKCLAELEVLSVDQSEPTNFDEFSRKYFGETLQKIFIRPYNEKVKAEILILRYPANCRGMGELWTRFASCFANGIFRFGQDVVDVHPTERKVITTSKDGSVHEFSYDTLISTIPITELGRISGLANDTKLRHSKVVLVGLGLLQPQSDFTCQLSWAYYPRPETVLYRCTVLSNFSPELTPDPERFWSVLCEIGMRPADEVDEARILQRTKEDLIKVGILESTELVYSHWMHVLPYGYPIPTLGREEELERCQAAFNRHRIYSCGRFGGWKYEISNQDHSFEAGRTLIDALAPTLT